MMADTVKKSRIVSDDEKNLEEALLEEFNMRLKNCMSKEDALAVNRDEPEDEDHPFYESVTTSNGNRVPRSGTDSNDFLKNERHHYDLPPNPPNHPPSSNNPPDDEENIYETLPEEEAIETEKTEPEDQRVEDGPRIEIEASEEVSAPEEPTRSAKARMLLATDDASTLLFTQTVTSPMLTPSEENIDFLRGFQEQEPAVYENSEAIYENLKGPQPVENIYENLKEVREAAQQLEEHIYQDIDEEEGVYESVEGGKDLMVDNSLYDNVEDEDVKEEEHYETLEDAEATEQQDGEHHAVHLAEEESHSRAESESCETHSEEDTETEPADIVNKESVPAEIVNKESVPAMIVNKESVPAEIVNKESVPAEIVNKESVPAEIVNKESVPAEIVNKESVPAEIVNKESVPAEIGSNLKSQFSKNGGVEVVSITRKEVEDFYEITTTNIMEQVNKFENSDSGDSNDSTVTESYSETTTIQSDAPEEKSLKKKKIKKSRKEEKENISVNDFDVVVNEEEYVYNVNVKNLCRSFGDLTKIAEDKQYNRRINKSGRTKSLTNVLLSPNNNIENVFSEVSVRSLKEKFNIVENKNSLGLIKTQFKAPLKSSFSKFDALQKKNVLHIRSSDSTKAQDKFNGSQAIDTSNCRACSKQVFQMEQMKAEKAVWHKNCFRCNECSKQLNVETYASHDGNLYCKPHFKSLFAPKVVEEESPPSDKPDLGLEDLQSLNVKERFQVFEQYQTETHESDREPAPINVKKSSSILSKLARFQAKGMDVGVTDDALNGIPIEESSSEEEEVEEEVPEGEDPTLYRAKRAQKEKPFHFTNLSEVKNKWEQGEQNSRDERREERKQEIQSIRNKLFLGKQGKMKEAYQQAIIQSESCTNMVKSEKIESCDTKSLKERFEKGQLATEKEVKSGDEDTEVFQSEISKKSRSLFLELDANASKPPQISPVKPQKLEVQKARESDTPERDIYHDPEVVRSDENVDDSVIAKTSHTASKMLNKFRQMEEKLSREPEQMGPKPLKRFTPPPEPTRPESDSEEGSESEEESEEGEDQMDNQKLPEDLVEAQKAARAKQLRAKFEKWEAQEIKREQTQTVNIVEEYGDESQVESTKSLRARFESMRETGSDTSRTPRVKVNRFVEIPSITEACESCDGKVYPLEKISVHGQIYHKNCFKCKECSCVLRMDTYSYNQGLLYCTPHFKRLFITKGNYDTAFGLDQHKEKWNINATMA